MQVFFRLLSGYLAQLVPFAVLCAFPFRKNWRFSRKKTALLTAALILGMAVFFAASGVFFSSVFPHDYTLFYKVNGMFLFCLLPCFFWYLYAIKAVWQKKLFIFSFALTSALLAISICNFFFNNFFTYEAQNYLPYEGPVISLIAIIYPSVAVSLCLLLHYFYMPVEREMNQKEAGYLAFLSLFLFLILVFAFTQINAFTLIDGRPDALILYFTVYFTIFLLYGVMFKMYALSHAQHIAQEKLLRLQYQNNIRDEQYRRISDSIDLSRKQRHDLRHHLLTLQGLWENGETAKARDYLTRYLDNAGSLQIKTFCSNPIINMLASHYSSLAAERGITLTAHISVPDALSVQDTDLSVLIGNLLENALDAADRAPEEHRSIQLNMLCRGKMIVITVDNGFDGVIQKEGERYLSIKPGHQGLGLQILQEIAEKYGGGAEFTYDNLTFHSSVMLRGR